MNNLKYSIIYGVIRPEISEQLSLGIIIVNGDKVNIRYSEKKLSVLQALFTKREYEFVRKVLRSMSRMALSQLHLCRWKTCVSFYIMNR